MFHKDSTGNVHCTCGKSLQEHSREDLRWCAAEPTIVHIDDDTWVEMNATVKYVNDPGKVEKDEKGLTCSFCGTIVKPGEKHECR